MNGRWHIPRSQKVWISPLGFGQTPSPVRPQLSLCYKVSPEDWEKLMRSYTGRDALSHSRGLCEMLVVSLFFRAWPCLSL